MTIAMIMIMITMACGITTTMTIMITMACGITMTMTMTMMSVATMIIFEMRGNDIMIGVRANHS